MLYILHVYLFYIFESSEMVSAAQVLGDIEAVPFDKDDKVQPQIEEMNSNLMTSTWKLCWRTTHGGVATMVYEGLHYSAAQ